MSDIDTLQRLTDNKNVTIHIDTLVAGEGRKTEYDDVKIQNERFLLLSDRINAMEKILKDVLDCMVQIRMTVNNTDNSLVNARGDLTTVMGKLDKLTLEQG